MPSAQLTNTAGVNGLPFSSGPVTQDVHNHSTSVVIPFGTLVALTTPITTTTTTVFDVGIATSVATTAPLNIGIATGGAADVGPGSSIAASGTGQAVIHGHCRALVDTTTAATTVGSYLVIGGVTPGCLGQAASTTTSQGLSYGVSLEVLTTTTAGTLVNIWFEKT